MVRAENSQPDMILGQPSSDEAAAAFDALVGLITQEQQQKLTELKARLDDDHAFMARVAEALPEVLLQRGSDDPVLATILAPTIERTIEASVQQDPDALAEKLMPVVQRSVRLTVNEALGDMVSRVNQLLEHSLNIRWRLEAIRTGRPFSEVVLVHTLIYRVEQVFLIYKESGILLRQLTLGDATQPDGELISAMLTAIQDFVQDSFAVSEGLDTVTVGELRLFVEQGEQVVVAAVVRGIPPAQLSETLETAVMLLELQFREPLATFAGDSAPFELADPVLRGCMTANFSKPQSRVSAWFWRVGVVLLLVLGWLGWQQWQFGQQWQDALKRIDAEPGLVVLDASQMFNRYSLKGLRDPLATPPQTLLAEQGLADMNIDQHWQIYASLESQMILKRAKIQLDMPDSVEAEIDSGILTLSGTAPTMWLHQKLPQAGLITGVHAVKTQTLYNEEQYWYDTLIPRLQDTTLEFEPSSTELVEGERATLITIKTDLALLNRAALVLGRDVVVQLIEDPLREQHGEPTPRRLERAHAVVERLNSPVQLTGLRFTVTTAPVSTTSDVVTLRVSEDGAPDLDIP